MLEKITLLIANPKTKTIFEQPVQSDYPLYPLLKLLQTLAKDPEQQKKLSSEEINQVRDETLEKLKKSKLVLRRDAFNFFEGCIECMGTYINHLDLTCNFMSKLLQSVAIIIPTLKKHVKLKTQSNKFHRVTSHFLSTVLIRTGIAYFKSGQLPQAETYFIKHLTHLETLPINDQIDTTVRHLVAKLFLAQIYLKFGYLEAALNCFEEIKSLLQNKYYPHFDDFLPEFSELYKNVLVHFYKNDPLKALKIHKSFLATVNILKDVTTIANDKTIQKNLKFIPIIFQQARENYQAQFDKAIKLSPTMTKTIDSFVFDFEQNCLTLHFKDKSLNKFLIPAFKSKHIDITQLAGSEPDSWFRINDLTVCNAIRLDQVCQRALALKAEELARQAEREKIAHQEVVMPVVQPTSTQESVASSIGTFTSPVISQPLLSQAKSSVKVKTRKNAPGSTAATTTSSPIVSNVQFYFPQSELTYNSSEKNQDKVKALYNNFIPDHVYFAYIPDWVKTSPHYKGGFENKLTHGLIRKDCVRNITKELQLWDNQNTDPDHPWKYKIVIGPDDYRLYGYIKETIITPDGKHHHLICFNYLMNHKDQKAQYLPDPIAWEKQNQNDDDKKLRM